MPGGRQRSLRTARALALAAFSAGATAGPAFATTGAELFRDMCVSASPSFETTGGRVTALGGRRLPELRDHLFSLMRDVESSAYWEIDRLDGAPAKILVGVAHGAIAGRGASTCFIAGKPFDLDEVRHVFPAVEVGERHDGGVSGWSRVLVDEHDGPPRYFLAWGGNARDAERIGRQVEETVIGLTMVAAPAGAPPMQEPRR